MPVVEQIGPAGRRRAVLARLADPLQIGMTTTELDALAATLAPAQAARAQQRYAEQRSIDGAVVSRHPAGHEARADLERSPTRGTGTVPVGDRSRVVLTNRG